MIVCGTTVGTPIALRFPPGGKHDVLVTKTACGGRRWTGLDRIYFCCPFGGIGVLAGRQGYGRGDDIDNSVGENYRLRERTIFVHRVIEDIR